MQFFLLQFLSFPFHKEWHHGRSPLCFRVCFSTSLGNGEEGDGATKPKTGSLNHAGNRDRVSPARLSNFWSRIFNYLDGMMTAFFFFFFCVET